ncbi:MAG: KpsF/GutQ family sugar-phosphate isomerase [Succinivibrionaceae bacterium]
MFSFTDIASKVILEEITALEKMKETIDVNFTAACELILACKGKVIVSGMGKSGHIASKIAATLASTGTPAFFVHPGEASHGDLGMISENDIVIAISNSGESSEITSILPILKRKGIKIIGISGCQNSTLAKYSDTHILVKVDHEACPLNLAPTSSTTCTLVLGDALAIALLKFKGFTEQDFALSHPGGTLGKRLLTTVEKIMHTSDELPISNMNETLENVLLTMTSKGLGMVAITSHDNSLYSIFTDGDLRRAFDAKLSLDTPIKTILKNGGITVKKELLAAEALKIMEDKKINCLVVVNEKNEPIGAFNMHDLLKVGIM